MMGCAWNSIGQTTITLSFSLFLYNTKTHRRGATKHQHRINPSDSHPHLAFPLGHHPLRRNHHHTTARHRRLHTITIPSVSFSLSLSLSLSLLSLSISCSSLSISASPFEVYNSSHPSCDHCRCVGSLSSSNLYLLGFVFLVILELGLFSFSWILIYFFVFWFGCASILSLFLN
jgi:hypothetical protein